MKRLAPSWIEALEIWDWPTASGPLHTRVGAPALALLDPGAALERLVAELAPVLQELQRRHQCASLWIGGGLSQLPGLGEALGATLSRDGRFVAERAGREVLGGEGLVVDVGQTAIKISRCQGEHVHRQIVERPRGADTSFVAEVLSTLSGPMVLGLPCEIDPGLETGPCSYGLLDIPSLLAPVPGPVWVANDAILAAMSASCEWTRRARTLVVTLGFGPGAAVLDAGQHTQGSTDSVLG